MLGTVASVLEEGEDGAHSESVFKKCAVSTRLSTFFKYDDNTSIYSSSCVVDAVHIRC